MVFLTSLSAAFKSSLSIVVFLSVSVVASLVMAMSSSELVGVCVLAFLVNVAART